MRIDCIDIEMFAPRGMNCMVCHKHCHTRKTQIETHSARYTCTECGGIVSLHDKVCIEYGKRTRYE